MKYKEIIATADYGISIAFIQVFVLRFDKPNLQDFEMLIVIVEDDRFLLRSLEIILKQHGHRVMSFQNAEAALFFLKQRPIMDVLVIDYQLQCFTAKHLLQQIKEVLPKNCKVILISGHTDVIEKLNLKEIGVGVFLPKPLDLDQLLLQITN